MVVLRRHRLVWLGDAGWGEVQRQPRDDQARACVAHWAAHHLPLVVTQQAAPTQVGASTAAVLALGLAAPGRWGRRKIALQVPAHRALYYGDFPLAADVAGLLPKPVRGAWLAWCEALDRLGVTARVHGSHGWQRLTGLAYLHAASDLDLHVAVDGVLKGDAVTELLCAAPPSGPCLDGELVFDDGAAVAWREWLQWRRGHVDRVLVKRLHGVALESGTACLQSDAPAWCKRPVVECSDAGVDA
ncbi:malonate decarboxylase holo-[acyl-carrier-protein] synthase [Methylibium sp.]|uniref:malonate decarboxylase holo-[acyl-carrier-protein] synthase n=1 Tax=Methylibium sp. TaxID=2067992 RepID=UPI003D127C9B